MTQKRVESPVVPAVPPAMPATLLPLYGDLVALATNPAVGIDKPEALVRMLVLDAIRQFVRLTGRPPRVIYVPVSLEAALQVDRARNMGQSDRLMGRLRQLSLLFACRPVWDALEFRVE